MFERSTMCIEARVLMPAVVAAATAAEAAADGRSSRTAFYEC